MSFDTNTLRISYVRKQIDEISTLLKCMPKENLACSHDGKYYRYFFSRNGTQYYISKKDRATAVKLAEKKYYEALLMDLKSEEILLGIYQKGNKAKVGCCASLIEDEGIYRLLKDSKCFEKRRDTILTEEIKSWMEEEYDRNMYHPEKLVHKGAAGHYLRSKSEELIDLVLYQMGVAYRYECALNLREAIIYPDFTLKHPITGEITYWEHFGMMDNEQYVEDYHHKMKIYIANGIIPTINLITTYETGDNPFTIDKARRTVEEWLQQ